MQDLRDVTRRQIFNRFGIGSLALTSLLDRNLAAQKTALPAKAKNIIYLFMAGAPSQLDLFDFKPKLQQFNGQPCPEELIKGERFAFITGRKKELIVSSTGKKIFPARVENLFKMEPLISQVLLIGDRLPFLTALFTINPAVAAELKGMGEWREQPVEMMAQAPPVLSEIQKAVARVNRQLAPFEQVRKYRVLARDFSMERGELTATMKVRRARALENFKDNIAELYAGRE